MANCVAPLDQTTAQILWNQVSSQIHPFMKVLCLSGTFYRLMDENTKSYFASHFMGHVSESVMYVRDGTGFDRYFLGAPRHFTDQDGVILRVNNTEAVWAKRPTGTTQSTTSSPESRPAKALKIPRPPNAYILYRKERHSMVKEAHPGITNNQISQILGEAWNNESREVRQKYKTMSEKLKQSLMEKYPDYQYRPRKPCEKKRRVRRVIDESLRDTGSSSPDSSFGLDVSTPTSSS